MSILKITLATTFLASSSAAFACPCPDKPMPLEVLAPQVTDVAGVNIEIYEAPNADTPSQAVTNQESVNFESQQPTLVPQTQTAQAETQMIKPHMQVSDTKEAKATETKSNTEMTIEEKPAEMTIDNKYEAVLKNRISAGADGLMLFDYAGAKSSGDLATIKDYVTALEGRDPSSMAANEATAYWANLYNAVTLRVVLENYPVKSIKKIGGGLFGGGPWKKDEVTVGGRALSLDNIEHDILRKDYSSPYIHYMVNCASIGCPNLQPKLWTAETLDADRKKAASEFINSSRGVSINGSKLKVSSIYKWFKEDFGGNDEGVIAHLKLHAKGDLKAALDAGAKISGDDYNWNLNE